MSSTDCAVAMVLCVWKGIAQWQWYEYAVGMREGDEREFKSKVKYLFIYLLYLDETL